MVCRSGAAVKAVASDGHLGVELVRGTRRPLELCKSKQAKAACCGEFLASPPGHGWEKGNGICWDGCSAGVLVPDYGPSYIQKGTRLEAGHVTGTRKLHAMAIERWTLNNGH